MRVTRRSFEIPGLRRERGGALISVLVALGFVLTLSLFTYFHQTHRLASRAAFLSARRAGTAAGNTVLEDFLSTAARGASLLDCRAAQESRGGVTIARLLCGRNLRTVHVQQGALIDGQMLSRGRHFPQFSFGELFQGSDRCRYRSARSNSRTFRGFSLSPSAAASKFDCRENPSGSYQRGNLSAAGLWSPPSGSSLAVRGYAEFPYGVEVTDELLIVAGGDIYIAAAQAATPSAQLTLVSATGGVQLQSVDPALSVRIIAWLGASLPLGTRVGGGTLLPPALDFEMLGFEYDY